MRLMRSAAEAGLTPSEVNENLESPPAAFPYQLAEAWQISDALVRQLEQTISDVATAGLFDPSVEFRSKTHERAFRRLKPAERREWLRDSGYWREVADLTYRSTCRAVATDLVEFANVALSCTIRGPLTVGFALLRKPLKDDLFALEWIVADPEEYFQRFFSGTAQDREVRNLKAPRQIEIIRTAAAKTTVGEWIPADMLHDLRFNKNSSVGLEPLWQKANHLVTTQGVLTTQVGTLNFVFSDDDERDEQWRAFCGVVPALFFHATQVLDAALAAFAGRAEPGNTAQLVRTLAGMTLWMRSKGTRIDLNDQRKNFERLLSRRFPTKSCVRCGRRLSLSLANRRLPFEDGRVQCSGWSLHIGRVVGSRRHKRSPTLV